MAAGAAGTNVAANGGTAPVFVPPAPAPAQAGASEMAALRAELQAQGLALQAIAESTYNSNRIMKRWDGEGQPPDREDYQKTVAESV